MLACFADGINVLPSVIFKKNTFPEEEFLTGIYVNVHPKCWMDEEGIKL
jgi:hypothetical protein